MKYRKEIDGLRAIAVCAVLVFHFFPKIFAYGYLGVDMFFVISGFLISLYAIEETENNRFSFLDFYKRRIKRILPLTLTVLVGTLIFCYFILIGANFDKFLKSIIATLTFTANLFFFLDGGYFGSNETLKPLLHMWSLSTEEQFYLIFPFVFLCILKYVKSVTGRLICVAIITLLSFVGNYYLINASGANPAFFLTPFRIWQFGAGTIAALIYSYFSFVHSKYTLIMSMILLALGFFVLPKFIIAGFLVTTATACFLAKRYAPIYSIDLFFSNRYVRYIGLMSFSLYLWHWPILALMRYIAIDEPSLLWITFGIFLTFGLSYVSYNYIEEPFRKTISFSKTFCFVIGTTFCLLVVAWLCLHFNISQDKNDKAYIITKEIQTNYRCKVSDYIRYGGSRACVLNDHSKTAASDYNIALIGNSHAQMYVPALDKLLKEHKKTALLVPLNGCLPTVTVNINQKCLKLAQLNYDAFIADKNIKTIIIGTTWHKNTLVNTNGDILNDADKALFLESLVSLIQNIKNTNRDVYLVGPLQLPASDLASVLSRKIKFQNYTDAQIKQELCVPKNQFDTQFKNILSTLKNELGNHLLYPNQLLCDDICCYLGDDKTVYFSDNNHLGSYGVSKMRDLFKPVFDKY